MELIKINQSNGRQAVSSRVIAIVYTLHFTLYTSTLHIKCLLINNITLKSVKCKWVYTLDSYKKYSKKIFFLKKSVNFTLFVPKLLSISALMCKGMCKPPLHFLYLSC